MMEICKLHFYSWEFEHSNKSCVTYHSLTPPLHFPFLPVCLVLGLAQAPFLRTRSWGVLPSPFLNLGFCLYCRMHFPSLEPQSQHVLPQWDPLWAVCQICGSSVPKRTEELLPFTEIPSGRNSRLHVCCACRRVVFRVSAHSSAPGASVLPYRDQAAPLQISLFPASPSPWGIPEGFLKTWNLGRWHIHLAELHLKDVRMTVTGHIRSISAQYSVSNIAMGSSLENVENRLSKFDISLNTGFRLEFPGQDVLYVYFGNL